MKIVISMSQPRIVRIWRNLVHWRIFWPRRPNRDKNLEFSNQDGGRTPYWKSFFGFNSAPCCLIKTKFGARRQNRTHTKAWRWKCPISKIRHGGRTPYSKTFLWTHAQRCIHVIFCRCFFIFFMAALVGQTAERIFTKLSHVVDIMCYLRTY